jgi:signal transduction histidine kinase
VHRQAGYVYIILQGEERDALAARLSDDAILRTTLWTTAIVALLVLLMGLLAFRLITRPLRALTQAVRGFDANGELASALPVHTDDDGGDEITVLRAAFAQMGRRIAEQWRELTRQDQQRRELIANISHDLRTPLTSLHGYLETLRFKEDSLNEAERRHYLDIALGQSRKVDRLAQELFDLARLESGLVQPELEAFSLAELVQDVVEKCAPLAQAQDHPLSVDLPRTLPPALGDLGMIERVLTNLLDNAIRHTPAGTAIAVQARPSSESIQIEVRDSGPGIPEAMRDGLFTRASALRRNTGQSGGLGLVIVQRILELHGSEVRLADSRGKGAAFRFDLPVA